MPVTDVCDLTTTTCTNKNCDAEIDVVTITKDVVDIPKPVRATKRRIKSSRGTCKKGHKIDTQPTKGLTNGSSFGPNIMASIVYMFFFTLSLSSIADMLRMYGIYSVSKTTIMAALSAAVAKEKFASRAAYITGRLKDTRVLLADETPIRIGKHRGYALGVYRRVRDIHPHPPYPRPVSSRFTLPVF